MGKMENKKNASCGKGDRTRKKMHEKHKLMHLPPVVKLLKFYNHALSN